MNEFFRTPMGRQFYEHTMPELVKAINKLANSLPETDEFRCPICGKSIGFIDPIKLTKDESIVTGKGHCPVHGRVIITYTFDKKEKK